MAIFEKKKVIKLVLLAVVTMTVACGITKQPVISQQIFDTVEIGTDVTVLKNDAGEPYKVSAKGPREDIYEYLYIERIERAGDREQRHYIFEVKEGKIINKYFEATFNPIDHSVSY